MARKCTKKSDIYTEMLFVDVHICLISYNEIGIEAFEAFIKLSCLRLPVKIALYLL